MIHLIIIRIGDISVNLCLAFVYTEGKYRHIHKYVYTHRLYTFVYFPAISAERPRRNNILLTMSTATTKILVSNVILIYKELGLLRAMAGRRQWHPTPVLLPGKSHGWRSLVGYSPWGR